MTKVSNLEKDQSKLLKNTSNESSAIFPIFNGYSCDTLLLFQNYWKWKRGLEVTCHITIRTSDGVAIYSSSFAPDEHNCISTHSLLKNSGLASEFNDGTIEIKITCGHNIVYPFPAVLAYFKSKDGFLSVVHSAGRFTEEETSKSFSETNFYVTPSTDSRSSFVHIFCGKNDLIGNIAVELISSIGSDVISRSYCAEVNISSFQSKIIILDEMINDFMQIVTARKKAHAGEIFAKVRGESKSIFPRFICGYIEKESGHYCVTHTYREILDKNDVIEVDKDDNFSTITLCSMDPLALDGVIYPTALPISEDGSCTVNIECSDQINGSSTTITNSLCLSESPFIFKESLSPGLGELKNKYLIVSPTNGATIPSRIPMNLRYWHKDGHAFTDIALQFTTCKASPKRNYWFSGFTGKTLRNHIYLSPFLPKACLESNKCQANCTIHINLVIRGKTFVFSDRFNVTQNAKCILLEDYFFRQDDFDIQACDNNEYATYSWRIVVEQGRLQDVYCIGYNALTHNVFGDHSF